MSANIKILQIMTLAQDYYYYFFKVDQMFI